MSDNKLRPIEIDAIGELLNISLGTAATSASNMLSTRVSITTPKVEIKSKKDFDLQPLEPAVAVDIAYVEGINGNSIMILKLSDIRMIVDMLLGTETSQEDFELDELSMSAVCEVMNQMMGASATALSEILGKTVNISPPIAKEIEDINEFKESCFKGNEEIAVVTFDLKMGDEMKSEFINMLAIPLVKELVSQFLNDEDYMTDETEVSHEQNTPENSNNIDESNPQEVEGVQAMNQNIEYGQLNQGQSENIEASSQVGSIPQPFMTGDTNNAPPFQPAIAQSQPHSVANTALDGQAANQLVEMMQNMMALMKQQMEMNQMNQSRAPQKIKADTPLMSNLSNSNIIPGDFDGNLDMLMGVPIDVSVEIGRTKKLIKDVLEINKGSLIVLDRLAGEHVDLFANGQLVAKGDVVVIDDNFGIRVTELISRDIFGEE